MIHVVNGENHGLYARQLREMFRIRGGHDVEARGRGGLWRSGDAELDGGDDERAVYLLDLDAHESLGGFVRIRPIDGGSLPVDGLRRPGEPAAAPLAAAGAWQAAWLWVDPAGPAPQQARRRLLVACAEHVQSSGARRLVTLMETDDLAGLTGVLHELTEDAVDRMRDSLEEPKPLTYAVDEEDLALHGGLAQVQQEFDRARRADLAAARADFAAPAEAKARIDAMFARHDARPPGPGLLDVDVLLKLLAAERRSA